MQTLDYYELSHSDHGYSLMITQWFIGINLIQLDQNKYLEND